MSPTLQALCILSLPWLVVVLIAAVASIELLVRKK